MLICKSDGPSNSGDHFASSCSMTGVDDCRQDARGDPQNVQHPGGSCVRLLVHSAHECCPGAGKGHSVLYSHISQCVCLQNDFTPEEEEEVRRENQVRTLVAKRVERHCMMTFLRESQVPEHGVCYSQWAFE